VHTARVESIGWILPSLGEIWEIIGCNRIIGSVSFNNNWIIRVEMCQNGAMVKACLRAPNAFTYQDPRERGVLAGVLAGETIRRGR